MTESQSIRATIMDLLKTNFSRLLFWDMMETDLAMMCADLVDPINDAETLQFVKQLENMRVYLSGHDISDEDLEFLDEEIINYSQTKLISLYQEADDSIDSKTINTYARLSADSEGVIGIHQPFNSTQLSKLTNRIYEKTGLIKFFISAEKTIYGKIIAEIYDHPQKIPIATLVQSKKIDKDTGIPDWKKILLFGEMFTSSSQVKIRQITVPFYVYRMITEENKEYIVMSADPCEIGDYIITGCIIETDDNRMLTDSAKLPTKLPFIFVQRIQNRIIKYKNHQEFKEAITKLNIIDPKYFDYPFSIRKGRTTYKFIHPDWYKWLVWSWLTHKNKGIFNNYPMHLMIVGPKNSGKSNLLNALHLKSRESLDLFSGSGSTLKKLVPSFKYNPARLGYLAESNRFAFCDEFLRCLTNTRSNKDSSAREESVAVMNDLLEHQKRQAGSGVSSVKVNMTARILATTNPIRDINTTEEMLNSFDESFLSRWLILFQTEYQVKLVRDSMDSKLDFIRVPLNTRDWVSILDYLHTFDAEYDMAKVEEIYDSVPNVLSSLLNDHYSARHRHHIECMIDGIIKTRCLLSGNMSFKANKKDYEILKKVWTTVIRSWINPEYVKRLPKHERIYYLPEDCQDLYWTLQNYKFPLHQNEIKDIAIKMMNIHEYYSAMTILVEMEVLIDEDNIIKPHYMGDKK